MNVKDVERVGASVSVRLPDGGNGVRITAELSYHATWRGQPVRVDMEVARQQDPRSDIWSPWWVIPRNAREGRYDTDTTEAHRGKEVSETARQRLREACNASARAWIDTDEASRLIADAYYRAVVREVKDARPWDFMVSSIERLISLYGDAMGSENVTRARALADAFGAWVAAIAAADA